MSASRVATEALRMDALRKDVIHRAVLRDVTAWLDSFRAFTADNGKDWMASFREDFDPEQPREPAGGPGGGQFASGGGGGSSSAHEPTDVERAEHAFHVVKGVLGKMVAGLRAAPGELARKAVKEVKETLHDAKNSFAALKAVFEGQDITDEQKASVKRLAVKVATSLVAHALTGAIPVGLVAHSLMGEKVLEKLSHHVAHHILEHFVKNKLHIDAMGAMDPEEWLAKQVSDAVADALSSLSDKDIQALADGKPISTDSLALDWNPDQPRDEQGRFGEGGSGASAKSSRSWMQGPAGRVAAATLAGVAAARGGMSRPEEPERPLSSETVPALEPSVRAALTKIRGAIAEGTLGNASPEEHLRIANDFLAKHEAGLTKTLDDVRAAAPKDAKVAGRTKDVASALEKVVRKPKYGTVANIQDGTGVRVIAKDIAGVRATVDALKSKYKVLAEDNYIDNPKDGYRSHHLVIEHDGVPKEVQIRTEREHEHSTWAHNAYKPHTDEQQQALKEHGAEISKYSHAMSDHLFDLDSGARSPRPAPAPLSPQLAKLFGTVKSDAGDFDEGQHPRGEGGRFSETAGALTKAAFSEGGFTYRPGASAPKSGYIVSLHRDAGLNHVIDIKDLAAHATSLDSLKKEVVDRVQAHLEKSVPYVNDHPEHYVGGYVEHDEKTGAPVALHLDVNEHHADRDQAIESGKARNQISIWDVGKGEEIKTGGTGRAETPPGHLPEDPWSYFHNPPGTKLVPIDKLTTIRARATGIEHAEALMQTAREGTSPKRGPISVESDGKGGYKVLDGNSTTAIARKHGWKHIPAIEVGGSHDSGDHKGQQLELGGRAR